MRLALFASLVCVVFEVGCASTRVPRPAATAAASPGAPARADTGALVIYRTQAWTGALIVYAVKVDGRVIGNLEVNSAVRAVLGPGPHKVAVAHPFGASADLELNVDVTTGETTYARVELPELQGVAAGIGERESSGMPMHGDLAPHGSRRVTPAARVATEVIARPPSQAVERSPAPVKDAGHLAVLEFRGDPTIPVDVLAAMADEARVGALSIVRAQGYSVLTRENMLAVLRQMGTCDAAEGECEVETARNIGADLLVTGQVVTIGTTHRLSLKLFSSKRGTLLAGRTIKEGDLAKLVDDIAVATREMMKEGLALDSDP